MRISGTSARAQIAEWEKTANCELRQVLRSMSALPVHFSRPFPPGTVVSTRLGRGRAPAPRGAGHHLPSANRIAVQGPASLGVPHTPFFAPSAIRLGVRTHPKTLPLQRASVDRRRDVPLSLRRKFHSGTVVSLSESQSFERTTLLSLLTFCFLFLSYTSWLQCSLLIFVFTNNTRSDRHGPHNRAFLSLALDTLRLALQAVVSLLPRSCGAGRPHFLPSGLFLSSSSSPRLRFSSEPE